MNAEDLKKQMVKVLEDNLSDPLERNKKWIYDDLPRLDMNDYPRIGVEVPADITDLRAVGDLRVVHHYTVIVWVVVRQKQKVLLNEVEYRDVELLNMLVEQIIDVVRNNQQRFDCQIVYPTEIALLNPDGSVRIKEIRFNAIQY